MKKSLVAASLLFIIALSNFAQAATPEQRDIQWQKTHVAGEQVNKRLAHQNMGVNNGAQSGGATNTQAATLHRKDRQIQQEKRAIASQNGGRITKKEQKTLRQQKNKVSGQIGK